eukprot:CAMPEP_0172312352 /NCGR_PEP_ID=MMETSP1058-20130122/17185_1 /TAXON_ID=83371 /ORGANISM="Detonula confervacea, Strain CCMP 353" /LENGTH=697 /DNA_ID=CAMNT_0013025775 /DNA_START=69 /DNA_END=2162 /DNA_ORIENTATION=-
MPSTMPLLLASAQLASLFMLLPSSASCHAAELIASPSIRSRQHHQHQKQQQQQRRVQTANSTTDGNNNQVENETNPPSPAPSSSEEHEEWYLPDVKVQIKKTWLFGAGDPSEWGAGVNSTNNATSKLIPTPIIDVPLFAGEYITDISAGGLHSAILTNEGRILTAGSSSSAGRGLGRDTMNGTEMGFMPITEVYDIIAYDGDDSGNDSARVESFTSLLPLFVRVVASQYYTFALDNLGNVWSTGNNAYAQLCLNDTDSRDRFHQVKLPKHIDENLFDHGSKIIDIVLGERHSLLLREDGKAYGCGWNQYGQLGIGVKGTNVASPVEIQIDAPDGGTAATNNSNNTKEGDDANGNGTISSGGSGEINHQVITNVVAGRGSSYFLTSSGHVYATGTNYKGQLCLGHREDRTLPTILANVESFLRSGTDFSYMDEGVSVESIAAGKSAFYLRLSNGLVLACGENTHGQLGIGNDDETDSVDVPTTIANVTNVTAVFSGPTSFGAYFVSSDRSIYAVGFDGVGARENWNVPNMMACANEETTLKKGVVISSGNDHTLYLATVETTFECEGDVLTKSPSMTPAPSISHMPSVHPSASIRPTISSMPTMTITPTTSPTASFSPTAIVSSFPSAEGETASPTPFGVIPDTLSPTVASDPSTSPVATPPTRNIQNPGSGGADGYSLGGFQLSLLGVSLAFMWQWF